MNEEEEPHPSEYINFMRGDCSLLAQAISDISHFPMYGIVDERGDMHHVFVYDTQTKEAIDCRGRMPLENLLDNISGERNTYRETSPEEVKKIFGTYSDEEYTYRKTSPEEVKKIFGTYSAAEYEYAEEKAQELI